MAYTNIRHALMIMHVRTFLTMSVAKRIIKTVFILAMFVLNILYVALPSIEKYFDERVMIEVDNILTEALESPSITFATVGGREEDGG